MTLSDERLREIAKDTSVYFGATRYEGAAMARELLSRRASPHGEAGAVAFLGPDGLPSPPERFPQPWRDDPAKHGLIPLYTWTPARSLPMGSDTLTDERLRDLTRPIIGIENRTSQEAFDIMCDRIRSALASPTASGIPPRNRRAKCHSHRGAYPMTDAEITLEPEGLDAKLPDIDPEFIVICGSAWMNETGFGIGYDWDRQRFNNRNDAIKHGWKLRGSDDFNIGQTYGDDLIWFGWMDQRIDESEDGMREIAEAIGLTFDPKWYRLDYSKATGKPTGGV